ncbi:hypothetical protein LSTR_LSTR012275 [Laodelphax striatellus]|uniref:Solute carrier family 12 member 9 n=1 Tax=Laodelphax striatellus TaxID=195883 RepID=A0A482WLN3_LAOST|nr:hypothetical protein LSTR_LSTR012275 [Laodelphax striatellus]
MLMFISKGVWKSNPLAAVFLSWALVQLILLIGSLNLIAQINSVLFLLSYLATNLACLGLDLASAPNFRPSFKYFSWYTALIGLIGTLVMMFVINSVYAASSIVLCLLLVLLLHLFSPSRSAHWGSISQALIFHQVRKYLLMLDSRKDHVKFWRPQMLLMVANPRSCCPLIAFVNDLKKSGLYVVGHVKVGAEFSSMDHDPTLADYSHWLALVDHVKVKAFIELTVAKSVREGLHHLVHLSGLGAMKPNTIVFGFYDDEVPQDYFLDADSAYRTVRFQRSEEEEEEEGDGGGSSELFILRQSADEKQLTGEEFVSLISDVLRMKKNVCVCRHFHTLDKAAVKSGKYKYIDVWPVNFFQPTAEDPFNTTSLFMLQLACIINMVRGWKHLQLRVFLCDSNTTVTGLTEFHAQRSTEQRFRHLLHSLRIKASIHPVAEWSTQLASLRGGSVFRPKDDEVPASHVAKTYLSNTNQVMRQHSPDKATALLLLYLPQPPSASQSAAQERTQYLHYLNQLTADLPATLLVHGISTVTSTTL